MFLLLSNTMMTHPGTLQEQKPALAMPYDVCQCLPVHIVTYSKPSWPACWPAWLPGPANQISQTGSLDTTAITRSISGLAFGTMPGNIMPLEPTKTRVIYYRVSITKQLEGRDLESCIICLPMFFSR